MDCPKLQAINLLSTSLKLGLETEQPLKKVLAAFLSGGSEVLQLATDVVKADIVSQLRLLFPVDKPITIIGDQLLLDRDRKVIDVLGHFTIICDNFSVCLPTDREDFYSNFYVIPNKPRHKLTEYERGFFALCQITGFLDSEPNIERLIDLLEDYYCLENRNFIIKIPAHI